jgi:hypothetical protein
MRAAELSVYALAAYDGVAGAVFAAVREVRAPPGLESPVPGRLAACPNHSRR